MNILAAMILVLCMAAPALAQPYWSFDRDRGRVQTNIPHAAGLPGTCATGDVYVNETTGFAWCDPANTWNVVGSGTITGSGTVNRLTYWSGATGLTSNAGFVVDPATQKVTIGDAATASGRLALAGVTSGAVALKAADAAGSATFALPIADGSNGDCLVTDGAGQLAFSNICTGSGSGISSLGGLSAATQTFAAGSTNINFSSSVSTHTFTWTGQLSLARGGTGADLTAGSCSNCFVKTNVGPTALTLQAPPILATQGGTGFTGFGGGVGGIFWANSTTTMALTSPLTNHGVLLGGGAGTPKALTPGAVGLFLQSQGAGADPIWAPGGGGGGCAGGGRITIADLNTSGTVTFTSPMADALYSVALAITPGTGSPGGIIYNFTNQTVNGFTVNISAAPGTGQTSIVTWIVTPSSCTF